jgi:hypothetical protein
VNAPARLALFAVAAAAAFGLGFGVGDAVGPFQDTPTHEMTPPAIDGPHGWHGQEEGR